MTDKNSAGSSKKWLPCPFCGDRDIRSRHRGHPTSGQWVIECGSCSCELTGFASQQDAWACWNKRPAPETPQPTSKELALLLCRAAGWLAVPEGESAKSTRELIERLVAAVKAHAYETPAPHAAVVREIYDRHNRISKLLYGSAPGVVLGPMDSDAAHADRGTLLSLLTPAQRGDGPVQETCEGLPESQEPKYTVANGRIVNRASGQPIPDDEPVFILRAKDREAVYALMDYRSRCLGNADHYSAVDARVGDFLRFKEANPARMKAPDTGAAQKAFDIPARDEGETPEEYRKRLQLFGIDAPPSNGDVQHGEG